MADANNLKEKLEQKMPPQLVECLKLAGRTGRQTGKSVYLVGGVVRDVLLGKDNLDIDLVVEGDASAFTQELASILGVEVIARSLFNTAKIKWERWTIDIAAARIESYRQPGQLPTLEGQTDLRGDLGRRDFTINAMAVALEPDHFGEIIDVCNGRKDLKAGLIRVMHDKSFQDDATRIWRAARYEQRLNFQIEAVTLSMIRRDIAFLDTISADRQRNELELCLAEDKPDKVLARAAQLGICRRLSASWQVTPNICHNLVKARTFTQPYAPPNEVYLAILLADLNRLDLENLVRRLNLGRSAVITLQDSLALKDILVTLGQPALTSGQVYRLLKPFSTSALLANRVILDSGLIRARIDLFLTRLKMIKPVLTGADLIRAGFRPGPAIGQILEELKEARLDGRVTTEKEEMALAKKIGQPGN